MPEYAFVFLRQGLNLQTSCLLNAGTTGMHHNAQVLFEEGASLLTFSSVFPLPLGFSPSSLPQEA